MLRIRVEASAVPRRAEQVLAVLLAVVNEPSSLDLAAALTSFGLAGDVVVAISPLGLIGLGRATTSAAAITAAAAQEPCCKPLPMDVILDVLVCTAGPADEPEARGAVRTDADRTGPARGKQADRLLRQDAALDHYLGPNMSA